MDQVRTVTRFASAETDDEIAQEAPSMTVTELRRQAREVKLEDVQEAHHSRFLTWSFDENHPVVDIRGRLVDTEGANLRNRDKGCRFPGCERTRWVHFHHLIPQDPERIWPPKPRYYSDEIFLPDRLRTDDWFDSS